MECNSSSKTFSTGEHYLDIDFSDVIFEYFLFLQSFKALDKEYGFVEEKEERAGGKNCPRNY